MKRTLLFKLELGLDQSFVLNLNYSIQTYLFLPDLNKLRASTKPSAYIHASTWELSFVITYPAPRSPYLTLDAEEAYTHSPIAYGT